MKYLELVKVYQELEQESSRLNKTEILAKFLIKIKSEPELIYLAQGKVFPDYDTRELGISTQLAVKALSKSSGLENKEVVKLWKKIGDLGKVAEQVMQKKKQSTLSSRELSVEKVLENLRKLPELQGKGTVDKKMSLVSELLISASPIEAKYIIRTLLQDLRIGVGEGVVRDSIAESCLKGENSKELVQEAYDKVTDFSLVFEKACKGRHELEKVELIPGRPIKVMLALKAENIKEGMEKVGKPAACFPRGETIFSNPSIAQIEELKENSLVMGKNGKFQTILKTFERDYQGELIKIHPHYLFPFKLTPEHKLMAIKSQKCSWRNRKTTCRPNCQEQKYGCKKNYKNYEKEWLEASKLEKGDFLLFPKFKEVKEIEEIYLPELNKGRKLEIKDSKVRSFSEHKGTFKGNWINQTIKLSNEFFELMGWYLAEGSFGRSGIKFSLGFKEGIEAERIKELIKTVFDINAKISKKESVIEIKAHSVLLPFFFKESFGNYSTNKKIPSFIMYATPEKIKEFFKAYIKGDGHKTKENIWIICSASKNIAYQSVLLLSKIGILPSVGKYKNKGLGDIIYRIVIFGKQVNNLERNSHKTKTNHQRFFEDNEFFYIPIKKIETEDYNGKVFNLETEDHTYLSSAIVHNCEYKYDGFRMMINKYQNEIKIFTRRLEQVTNQFPEVVEYIKKHIKGDSFILDAEAVGYNPKTKKYLPFQSISQRIKRKYDIEKTAKELPVELNVFDILYYNGEDLIEKPFRQRTELLRKIIHPEKWKLVPSKQIITSDEKEAEKFYKEALKEGEEGVMFKALEAPYKPGARVGHMLKLKPSSNEFDLVIVKAEYGTGKRAGWLSSFTVACKNHGKLLEIGKVSTGLKEKPEEGLSFIELTKKLKPLIIKEHGREVEVKPEVVITVAYQDIQKSPSYESGFALRFPRFTALRPDRSEKDIATLEEVEKDYLKQREWAMQ